MAVHRKNLRRKMAQVAFLLALVWLGVRTCRTEAVNATLQFDGGDLTSEVTQFRVDVFNTDGEAVGYLESKTGLPEAPWQLRIDVGSYRAQFEVVTSAGRKVFDRQLELRSRAVVTVNLRADIERALDRDAL